MWPWLQPTWTNVSNGNFTLQWQQQLGQIILNPCINIQGMAWTSSVYNHFMILPSSVTLTFNLPKQMFQMALLLLKDNNSYCAKLFWNQFTNVKPMAWTSPKYDHFIIWSSSVTSIFNLPEQMFQIALFLLKDNNCAKLFWNPCINVQLMARTSSIYDHFIIWPSSVTLTFNLPKQMFQMALLLLMATTVPNYFEVCEQMYTLWPWQIWTDPSTTHICTSNWSCNNYVSLTTSRLDKNLHALAEDGTGTLWSKV